MVRPRIHFRLCMNLRIRRRELNPEVGALILSSRISPGGHDDCASKLTSRIFEIGVLLTAGRWLTAF